MIQRTGSSSFIKRTGSSASVQRTPSGSDSADMPAGGRGAAEVPGKRSLNVTSSSFLNRTSSVQGSQWGMGTGTRRSKSRRGCVDLDVSVRSMSSCQDVKRSIYAGSPMEQAFASALDYTRYVSALDYTIPGV
jgi:hypothetical protein